MHETSTSAGLSQPNAALDAGKCRNLHPAQGDQSAMLAAGLLGIAVWVC